MSELNKRRTDYNLNVWISRPEASKKLEEAEKDIKAVLESVLGERELVKVTYLGEPLDSGENLWEARLSASNGVLKIEKRSLEEEDFTEETLVPPGRLNYIIGELHPQIIIDFAKQVGKK